ncbi:hypothetical protein LINPERHAP1_LOCUS16181 [Linum perenne]
MIIQQVNNRQWQPIKVSRNGPGLSHLFFADDLLIFGKASVAQAQFMSKVFVDFCASSGQKVNAAMSLLFVSKKTPLALKQQLGNITGFKLTDNLGRYLGLLLYMVEFVKKFISQL